MNRSSLIVLPLLLGAGCKSGLFASDDPYDFTGYTLVFTLDAAATTAGTPVGYTAWLVDEYDAPVDGLTWAVASDLEGDLEHSATAVIARVAGDHAVTASTVYEGVVYTETEPLGVSAGPAADLDLRLSDLEMQAGGQISWEAEVIDAFGNTLDSEGVLVEVDDTTAVTMTGSVLSSTIPGTWLVTATWEELDDVEAFVVVPGPPVGVELALTKTDLELLQTTSAIVDVWDAYGNPSDSPWTVWTDRPDAVVVSHRNVTFFEEGWHTVHVTVDDTTLTDAVGPFLIDSTAPWLEITAPTRGKWQTQTTQTVTGTVHDDWSTVSEVDINGYSVTPGVGGAFSQTIPLYFGTNVIESVAADLDANVSTDTRAVLQGSFRAYNTSSPTGIQVRIEEGSGGIDTLEAIGEGIVADTDLDALIPDPVFYDYEETCTWLGCFTWYSLRLRVYNPDIAWVDLQIDPKSTGRLRVTFTAWYPYLAWVADLIEALEINISPQYGYISATNISVALDATPSVVNGALQVSVSNVSVGIADLNFHWNSWLWDVFEAAEDFGIPIVSGIESLIRNAMQNAIKNAVVAEVPGALEDALQDLELSYPFTLDGTTYTLNAKPDGVSVNETGISLSLGTKVTTSTWRHVGYAGLGTLNRGYTPSTSFTKPVMISMSGDFVSQMLYAVWGGGALDIVETSDSLGLPVEDLALFLPGVTQVTVEAYPLLPPVVVPGVAPYEYELQVGDLEVTLYDGPAANNDILIQAYVTAYVPLNLTNVGDTRLSASLGTPEIYFDVVIPEANTMAAGDTEALLEALVPLLLPQLTAAIGEIDIPSIQGFGITGIAVSTGGSNNGYLRLGGSLYVE